MMTPLIFVPDASVLDPFGSVRKACRGQELQAPGRGFGVLRTGRSAEIRTRDPLHPMQVRYQTAPRSDRAPIIRNPMLAVL